MDLKLNDIDSSNKELEAVLTYEELAPYFEKAFEDYRKKATLPGFRKGKAPLSRIKQLYGDGLEFSTLEDIVNEIFLKYIVDNKIDLLGKGSIQDIDYKPKEELKFKVKFEILPEVKVEDFTGIELRKTKYTIDDSRINDEIQYHKYKNSSQETDGAALDDEYVITVDLQNLDEAGNILIGQSQKDMQIYLGNKEIYPEFKEGFKGIREGETRIIESKNADGEPKKVSITCTKVEKIILPEMNEEFFKKITGKDIKTEKEFRDEIASELQKIYDEVSGRNLRNDVISEMVKLNDISVPDKYVDSILDSMVEDYKHQFPKHTLPKDFNKEEFKKERRADAILSAKWFMLREKLIEMNNIDATDEDYAKIAEQNTARYNIPVDKLIEAYKSNENVRMRILNDKVIDLIISKAKITETEEKVRSEQIES